MKGGKLVLYITHHTELVTYFFLFKYPALHVQKHFSPSDYSTRFAFYRSILFPRTAPGLSRLAPLRLPLRVAPQFCVQLHANACPLAVQEARRQREVPPVRRDHQARVAALRQR